jgi:hypothetical protein
MCEKIIDKIEKYIKKMFLNVKSWNNYSNFETTTELLADLSDVPDCNVRYALAENPKATTKLLTKLSNDPKGRVRCAVFENPNYKK